MIAKKTPLEMFEEQENKQCCRTCANLIVKNTDKGIIHFCRECGKIVLEMFLDCGNVRDCQYERKVNQ